MTTINNATALAGIATPKSDKSRELAGYTASKDTVQNSSDFTLKLPESSILITFFQSFFWGSCLVFGSFYLGTTTISKASARNILKSWYEERDKFLALFTSIQLQTARNSTEWNLAEIGCDLAGDVGSIYAYAGSHGINLFEGGGDE